MEKPDAGPECQLSRAGHWLRTQAFLCEDEGSRPTGTHYLGGFLLRDLGPASTPCPAPRACAPAGESWVPGNPRPHRLPHPAFPCPLLFLAKLSLAKGTQFVLEEN